MRIEQLETFRDPAQLQPLELKDESIEDGHIKSGEMINASGETIATFHDFVPSFVPGDNYTTNFGLQWQRHAKTQLDSFNGSDHSRQRLYRTAGWPDDVNHQGNRILEAGSGAGRFTEVLANTGGDLFTFDFSEAVHANFANNGRRDNVTIFRGNIYEIPFEPASFDIVVCLGVLQHTPDVAKSFKCLAAMVKPGGQLVVDAYANNLRQRIHWKYAMRPITTRMNPDRLYRLCAWYAPKLQPLGAALYRIAKPLRRLVPVFDVADKNVSREIRRDWCILDTYDALAAAYDQPQSAATLRRWFDEVGFERVQVVDGTVVTAHGFAPA